MSMVRKDMALEFNFLNTMIYSQKNNLRRTLYENG
jgi:hypothetical protein